RYVRAMTFTADMGVPINLSTAKDKNNPNGGVAPVLGDLDVKNPKVTNSDLLTDDPAVVATSLAGLLGGIARQFLAGGMKPIDLSSTLASFGLALRVPDGGIRKLSKGSDDYVAIFANLEKSMNAAYEADISAKLVSKEVDPNAMSLSTMSRDKAPTITI